MEPVKPQILTADIYIPKDATGEFTLARDDISESVLSIKPIVRYTGT